MSRFRFATIETQKAHLFCKIGINSLYTENLLYTEKPLHLLLLLALIYRPWMIDLKRITYNKLLFCAPPSPPQNKGFPFNSVGVIALNLLVKITFRIILHFTASLT